MCEHDMNITEVSRIMYMHRNSIEYHIRKMQRKYHLSPRKFYDLVELKRIADEHIELIEEPRICVRCGREIKNKNRKYCSEECRNAQHNKGYRRDMCIRCENSKRIGNTRGYRCLKNGKVVINKFGQGTKNSSECIRRDVHAQNPKRQTTPCIRQGPQARADRIRN